MASEVIVEAVDVHKSYFMGDSEVKALKGISLSVSRGEFITIVGPSGSGKSTFLNMLGGIGRPTSGAIAIEGKDITKPPHSEKTHLLRRNTVGFVYQFFNLIPTLTAKENVMLPMEFAGVPEKEREERALELLGQVGLSARVNHKPMELSGGEQQRVTIARALANQPAIVLADEPTGNLDTNTGKSIVELLQGLNKENKQTFIIVTHDLRVAKAADRVIYIKDGQIAQEKTVTQDSWTA
jgi:putative ABC transport system ATP-binding protein